MKRITSVGSFVLSAIMFASSGWTQESQLTALQILDKADEVINAPKDSELTMKLVLIDKTGKEEVREIKTLQKGSNKRVAKFLSPASQKGIAFLSLPGDIMYLYLPAFKKVRRIASHVKNGKFAGTDFTYEDMEATKLSEKYVPELLKNEDNCYVLQLKPKKDVQTDYSKQIMYIRTDNYLPVKIERYDKANKLCKTEVREKIEKSGDYWTFKESVMEDLKTGHKTKMIMTEVKYDTGLTDEVFTERFLTR